ncbi:MAG: ArsC family reductase [Venatoribacter sp.]
MIVYGIKNCDTVKKARVWLESNKLEYQFHDYKKEGLNAALLDRFISQFGYEVLMNKRGTTWRKLAEADKDNLTEEKAKALLLANSSLLKRPIIEHDNGWLIGFVADEYQQKLL